MRMRPSVEMATRLDEQVATADHVRALGPTMWSWSRQIREATGLPITTLAKRLKVSKQAVSKLEQNEATGSISLGKLDEIAEALNCVFVYGFVPKTSFALAAEQLQAKQDGARKAK